MFGSSSFYSDVHPTVEEQVALARKISESLSDANNLQSKGQSMYVKRKKKSVKWVHEGRVTIVLLHINYSYSMFSHYIIISISGSSSSISTTCSQPVSLLLLYLSFIPSRYSVFLCASLIIVRQHCTKGLSRILVY